MSSVDPNLCRSFLVASRNVARMHGNPTDRGWAVVSSGDYHLIQDHDGKTVWEGKAHCRYCARAEAITHAVAETVDAEAVQA